LSAAGAGHAWQVQVARFVVFVLDEGDHALFRGAPAAGSVRSLAADVGLVGLDQPV